MPQNNHEITIEDLAIITKEGFEGADKRFDDMNHSVNERFGKIETGLDKIEADINRLPDKAYLSDKLADREGSIIVRQRKEDKKVNLYN